MKKIPSNALQQYSEQCKHAIPSLMNGSHNSNHKRKKKSSMCSIRDFHKPIDQLNPQQEFFHPSSPNIMIVDASCQSSNSIQKNQLMNKQIIQFKDQTNYANNSQQPTDGSKQKSSKKQCASSSSTKKDQSRPQSSSDQLVGESSKKISSTTTTAATTKKSTNQQLFRCVDSIHFQNWTTSTPTTVAIPHTTCSPSSYASNQHSKSSKQQYPSKDTAAATTTQILKKHICGNIETTPQNKQRKRCMSSTVSTSSKILASKNQNNPSQSILNQSISNDKQPHPNSLYAPQSDVQSQQDINNQSFNKVDGKHGFYFFDNETFATFSGGDKKRINETVEVAEQLQQQLQLQKQITYEKSGQYPNIQLGQIEDNRKCDVVKYGDCLNKDHKGFITCKSVGRSNGYVKKDERVSGEYMCVNAEGITGRIEELEDEVRNLNALKKQLEMEILQAQASAFEDQKKIKDLSALVEEYQMRGSLCQSDVYPGAAGMRVGRQLSSASKSKGRLFGGNSSSIKFFASELMQTTTTNTHFQSKRQQEMSVSPLNSKESMEQFVQTQDRQDDYYLGEEGSAQKDENLEFAEFFLAKVDEIEDISNWVSEILLEFLDEHYYRTFEQFKLLDLLQECRNALWKYQHNSKTRDGCLNKSSSTFTTELQVIKPINKIIIKTWLGVNEVKDHQQIKLENSELKKKVESLKKKLEDAVQTAWNQEYEIQSLKSKQKEKQRSSAKMNYSSKDLLNSLEMKLEDSEQTNLNLRQKLASLSQEKKLPNEMKKQQFNNNNNNLTDKHHNHNNHKPEKQRSEIHQQQSHHKFLLDNLDLSSHNPLQIFSRHTPPSSKPQSATTSQPSSTTANKLISFLGGSSTTAQPPQSKHLAGKIISNTSNQFHEITQSYSNNLTPNHSRIISNSFYIRNN